MALNQQRYPPRNHDAAAAATLRQPFTPRWELSRPHQAELNLQAPIRRELAFQARDAKDALSQAAQACGR
jgi:hypothetical protein